MGKRYPLSSAFVGFYHHRLLERRIDLTASEQFQDAAFEVWLGLGAYTGAPWLCMWEQKILNSIDQYLSNGYNKLFGVLVRECFLTCWWNFMVTIGTRWCQISLFARWYLATSTSRSIFPLWPLPLENTLILVSTNLNSNWNNGMVKSSGSKSGWGDKRDRILWH